MKLQRNDPCPCRSGLKYKRCCLQLHRRARAANTPLPLEDFGKHFAALDAMGNQVPDLLRDGRYDEAKAVCHRLLEEHADQPDGLERLAEVYAAWGRKEDAALAFRRAAVFHQVLVPRNVKTIAWLFEQAERMDAGLDIAWPEGDLDGPE